MNRPREAMLTVSGLTKRFGGFTALNNVSFEVREGEILGLIGPNGSGKTTAFNCISGALAPTAGSIHFRGEGIGGGPPGAGSPPGPPPPAPTPPRVRAR